jgi:hypothetical protein
VLEAKAIAEAALHFARVTQAANETRADCLRMIVRPEMQMADEVDADSSVAQSPRKRGALSARASLSPL